MTKTYLEMSELQTFEERLEYLMLDGKVGEDTFGFDRYLNQALYKSKEWRSLREKIIIRDNGCDLGVEGYEINDRILIHHINPITQQDILERDACVFDPNNLISVSKRTHDAIHYSSSLIVTNKPKVRTVNDTCPWKSLNKE